MSESEWCRDEMQPGVRWLNREALLLIYTMFSRKYHH